MCWWCCHKEKQYVRLPVKFRRESENSKIFITNGYFCSFECSLAWAEDNHNPVIRRDARSLIYLYARGNYESDGNIAPAPPRETLRLFGGKLSIKQFRSWTMPKLKTKRARYECRQQENKLSKVGKRFGFNVKCAGV